MTVKVLYFTAGITPTTAEKNAIVRLSLDPALSVGARCVLFVDKSSAGDAGVSEELETCGGVAGTYPSVALGYANNYDAAIQAQTVKDYSAEAVGGPHSMIVVGGGSLSFSHTLTKQMAALKEEPDGTLSDVTTACVWTSGTPGTATVGSSTGLLTGVAAGTTVVTATLTIGGKSTVASATVTCT